MHSIPSLLLDISFKKIFKKINTFASFPGFKIIPQPILLDIKFLKIIGWNLTPSQDIPNKFSYKLVV